MKEFIDILDKLIVISEMVYKELEYVETKEELYNINVILDDIECIKKNIKKIAYNKTFVDEENKDYIEI